MEGKLEGAEQELAQLMQRVKGCKEELEGLKKQKSNAWKTYSDAANKHGGIGLRQELKDARQKLAELKEKEKVEGNEVREKRKEREDARKTYLDLGNAGVDVLPIPLTPKDNAARIKEISGREGKTTTRTPQGGGKGGKDKESPKGSGKQPYLIPKTVSHTQKTQTDGVYDEIQAQYPGLDGKALAEKVHEKKRRAEFEQAMRQKDGRGVFLKPGECVECFLLPTRKGARKRQEARSGRVWVWYSFFL